MSKFYLIKIDIEFEDGYTQEVLGIFTTVDAAKEAAEKLDQKKYRYDIIDICEANMGTATDLIGKPIMSYARTHYLDDGPRFWRVYPPEEGGAN